MTRRGCYIGGFCICSLLELSLKGFNDNYKLLIVNLIWCLGRSHSLGEKGQRVSLTNIAGF